MPAYRTIIYPLFNCYPALTKLFSKIPSYFFEWRKLGNLEKDYNAGGKLVRLKKLKYNKHEMNFIPNKHEL